MPRPLKPLRLTFSRPAGYRERYGREFEVAQHCYGQFAPKVVDLTMSLPGSDVMSQDIKLTRKDVVQLVAMLTRMLARMDRYPG